MMAFDLYCGLGGWAEGFLAEGWDVIGFDTERHDYGTGGYPGQLVLQDVTTLDGAQLCGTDVIVASPPCQAYSYRAMPWKKAKALPPPDNTLFESCFRIQREASAAAGRHIPLVVENVCGAQPWVGKAKAHYGSYYLWGDVGSVGGSVVVGRPNFGERLKAPKRSAVKMPGQDWNNYAKTGEVSPHWRMQASPDGRTTKGMGRDGDKDTAQRRIGLGNWRERGRKVDHHLNVELPAGTGKTSWFFGNTKHELRSGIKSGGDWFASGEDCSLQRRFSSSSQARKAASAQIAKIPMPLAQHIARAFKLEARI